MARPVLRSGLVGQLGKGGWAPEASSPPSPGSCHRRQAPDLPVPPHWRAAPVGPTPRGVHQLVQGRACWREANHRQLAAHHPFPLSSSAPPWGALPALRPPPLRPQTPVGSPAMHCSCLLLALLEQQRQLAACRGLTHALQARHEDDLQCGRGSGQGSVRGLPGPSTGVARQRWGGGERSSGAAQARRALAGLPELAWRAPIGEAPGV